MWLINLTHHIMLLKLTYIFSHHNRTQNEIMKVTNFPLDQLRVYCKSNSRQPRLDLNLKPQGCIDFFFIWEIFWSGLDFKHIFKSVKDWFPWGLQAPHAWLPSPVLCLVFFSVNIWRHFWSPNVWTKYLTYISFLLYKWIYIYG